MTPVFADNVSRLEVDAMALARLGRMRTLVLYSTTSEILYAAERLIGAVDEIVCVLQNSELPFQTVDILQGRGITIFLMNENGDKAMISPVGGADAQTIEDDFVSGRRQAAAETASPEQRGRLRTLSAIWNLCRRTEVVMSRMGELKGKLKTEEKQEGFYELKAFLGLTKNGLSRLPSEAERFLSFSDGGSGYLQIIAREALATELKKSYTLFISP